VKPHHPSHQSQPQERTRHEHEVVVVGARCAGASTAMLLARQGHDVLVVDRAVFPSDTLSTHAIARGGMVQLARWGLLDQVVASGAPEIRTISFHLRDGSRMTKTMADRNGVDYLLAPRRHVLDAILVQAAQDAGASFRSGLRITGTISDASGRTVGVRGLDSSGSTHEIRARFVVGADGVRSRIARSVGAAVLDERPAEGATHYAFVKGLDAEGFEYHIGDRAFAGVFPTHGGEANVWVCMPAGDADLGSGDRVGGFIDLLARTSPSLAQRVRRAEVTSPVRSALRFPNHVREATGPGWALVGDAGYHRDPITGHGMTDAFRDAELLARQMGRALREEVPEYIALATYADQQYRALAPIFDITSELAQYPEPARFAELQKQLATEIGHEAAWLEAQPPLFSRDQPVAA
jgi:2-polyprenyl-6-methoxyphenol hydroxylase-like FAD-dependent oxidoreductase